MEASVISITTSINPDYHIIPIGTSEIDYQEIKKITKCTKSNLFRLKQYLYDESSSVKDGRLAVGAIKIIHDNNTCSYHIIGEKVLSYLKITQFTIGDKYNVTGITLESSIAKNDYTLKEFITMINNNLEPKKEIKESSEKTESKNDFTLKEIKEVLHNILEPSEVEESMHEFVKYKIENTGIKIAIEEPIVAKKYNKIIVELTKEATEWYRRNHITSFSKELGCYGCFPKHYIGYYISNNISNAIQLLNDGYVFISQEDFKEHFINNEKWKQPEKKAKIYFDPEEITDRAAETP